MENIKIEFIKKPIILILLILCFTNSKAETSEIGVLLRSGEWRQGTGSFGIPKNLSKIPKNKWPIDNWFAIKLDKQYIDVSSASNGLRPKWLSNIIDQIPNNASSPVDDESENILSTYDDILYFRTPKTISKTGKHEAYIFKNGTTKINPILEYQYNLTLNEVDFRLRVQNGLKGKNGAPYGEGATYFIEYNGNQFEYQIGYYGWTSRIIAIADIDGDRYPDFIIEVDGMNSQTTFILLSSQAKPGKNEATASLNSWGC